MLYMLFVFKMTLTQLSVVDRTTGNTHLGSFPLEHDWSSDIIPHARKGPQLTLQRGWRDPHKEWGGRVNKHFTSMRGHHAIPVRNQDDPLKLNLAPDHTRVSGAHPAYITGHNDWHNK